MGEPKATVLGPGEGEQAFGITFKATGDDGLGHFSFGESHLEPGAPGPPLHIHNTHDEAFYVADGDLTMRAGDDTVLVDERDVRLRAGGRRARFRRTAPMRRRCSSAFMGPEVRRDLPRARGTTRKRRHH